MPCFRWRALVVGLLCLAATACQSAGRSGDADGPAMFGRDVVPRQSEPEIADESEPEAASTSGKVADIDEDLEAAEPRGNVLTRWLPGGDKDGVRRRPLPVTERPSALSSEDADEDEDF